MIHVDTLAGCDNLLLLGMSRRIVVGALKDAWLKKKAKIVGVWKGEDYII
jgi:hypothetical protein